MAIDGLKVFVSICLLLLHYVAKGQDFFFEQQSETGKVLRSKTFFFKKKAFEKIYYDEDGREKLSWIKKTRQLGFEQSLVSFVKYTGDSLRTEITLYCEIKKDLTFICFAGKTTGFNHGYYRVDKMTNQRTERTTGTLKLATKKRKFNLNEIPDVRYLMKPQDTEIFEEYDIYEGDKILLKNDVNYRRTFTNKHEGNRDKKYYFWLTYVSNQLVSKRYATVVNHESGKEVVFTLNPFIENDFSVNIAERVENYDKDGKILFVEEGNRITTFEYYGDYSELHKNYLIRNGSEILVNTIEVQKSFY